MSMLGGGFGLSASSSSSATAGDKGSENLQNTPVSVVAGNVGVDLEALLNGVANLQRQQSEPTEQALANSPSLFGGGGNIPSWVWLAVGALVVFKLLHRRGG